MVEAVVHPKFFEPFWRAHHMCGPMHKGIHQIPRKETWKKPKSEVGKPSYPKDHIEESEKEFLWDYIESYYEQSQYKNFLSRNIQATCR